MDNGACSYRRFLDGDDNGLAEIIRKYKDGLILFLNSYVNNIYIAEELAEETFFKIITKKPKFSGKSSFKSWLYAIGRNTAVDYIRHNSKIADFSTHEAADYSNDFEATELSYIKQEEKIAVHKAMSVLTPDYRNVLWLIYFENFSNKDAAVIMKKSDRQIKNLLYRAKASLKLQLKKEGFIYENL